jgi:hypothetical protein
MPDDMISDMRLILENQLALMRWAAAGETTASPARRDFMRQIEHTRLRLERAKDAKQARELRYFGEIPP